MTTSLRIADYLKYADLQMAAEAFIRHPDTGALRASGRELIDVLKDGNFHSSRFTEIQATEFQKHWEAVDQQANTTTGFSGTLFRNKDTNELVMSFRSTEFIDDAARDNQATNALEIAATGYAWGQIRDMEAWYQSLRDRGLLQPGQTFAVTGYSLGGHLATVFNLLHGPTAPAADQAGISQVVTFNAAGVGGFDERIGLKQLVQQFSAASTRSPAFSDDTLAQIYARAKAALAAGQTVANNDLTALKELANPPPDSGLMVDAQTKTQAQLIINAIGRIGVIRAEVGRLGRIGSGDGQVPVQWADNRIAQESLDYQMALLDASAHTDATSLLKGLTLTYGGKDYLNPDTDPNNQFDVVGDTSPSAVSNSQRHIGKDVRVFIEDQPLLRGNVARAAVTESFKYANVKLLVDGYSRSDFGDTHSLVLIVDSLNVQNTLLQMLPASQRTSEGAVGALNTMLRNASNLRKVDGDAVFGGSQGKAEGDVLENVLDALVDLALGPASQARLKGSPEGNSWHLMEDKDGYAGRDAFYGVLQQIQQSDLYKKAAGGEISLTLMASGSGLASSAHTDFGAFAALYCLSPFALSCSTPGALESIVGDAWGSVYADWKADKAALEAGATASELRITDQWLSDRAALLERKNYYNSVNASYDSSRPDAYGKDAIYGNGSVNGEDVVWEDRQQQLKIQRGGVTASTRYVRFGSTDDDADLIGGRRDDHLYGGAGADTLDGGKGDDYLEGGTGADTYVIAPDSGRDIILDADDQGTIQLAGRSLAGAGELIASASATQPYTVWLDDSITAQPIRYSLNTATQELAITGAGSTVIVRRFHDGDLGIAVPAATSPVAVVPPRTFDLATSTGRSALAALTPEQGNAGLRLDNAVFADARYLSVSGAAGNDTLTGGTATSPSGTILNGGGGDDRIWAGVETTLAAAIATGDTATPNGSATLMLAGNEGNDQLIGAAGDDILFGGTGDDTLVGGAGSDIILADGDNAGYQSHDAITAWSGGSNSAEGPGRWLRMRVHSARVGETGTNGTGSRVVTEHYIDQSIAPLDDTDLSGLLAMRAQDIVPDAGDTRSYLPGTQRTYAQVNGGKAMGTNVGSGADIIYAGAGDDIVNAGAGDDIVFAGSGMDAVAGYEGDDFIEGGNGADTLWGDYTAYNAAGAVETHAEFGATWSVKRQLDPARHGRDFIDGGEGNDTIYGGGQADALYGGAGDDLILGDDEGVGAPYAGDDYLDGGDGNDELDGGAGSDQLIGGHGDDLLSGDDGNDVLRGGTGRDTLDGGAGDDTYVFERGDGQDVILALDGTHAGETNVLQFGAGITRADIEATRAGNDLLLRIRGSDDQVLISSFYLGNDPANPRNPVQTIAFADGTSLASHELPARIQGSASPDRLYGSLGADALYGGDGNDFLYGLAGNDLLDGGPGYNELFGGEGDDTYVGGGGIDMARDDSLSSNDTYRYQYGDGFLSIEDKGGQDTLELGSLISPADVSVQVSDIGGLRNSVDLVFKGDASQSVSWSGVFDDITGALAADTAFERIRFADGTSWTVANIRRMSLQTSDGDDLVHASEGDDRLDGGPGNDDLRGKDGNDTLSGGPGDDQLRGDAGDDLLLGGDGNDDLVGMSGNDVLAGGPGNDQLNGHSGDDTYRYAPGDGNDFIDDNTGVAAFDDVAAGGFDRIELAMRPDQVSDIELFRGNLKLLFRDGGSLTIQGMYGSIDAALESVRPSHTAIEEVAFADGTTWTWTDIKDRITVLRGDANANTLTGSDRAERIHGMEQDDRLIGLGGDDQLFGGDGNDTLDAGPGNDTLDGGSGNDTLNGGTGDDTYLFSRGAGRDTVNESNRSGGSNTDVLQLGPGISQDQLLLRQVGDSLGIGIVGNDATITISNWYLNNSSRIEKFRFADGSNWDAAQIDAHVPRPQALSIIGTAAAEMLEGGPGDDTLQGLGGNDTISGGAGADLMMGGPGDDAYAVDNKADVVRELAGEGIDTVHTGVDYTLGDNVENLLIYASGAVNGTGNALDNVLYGGTGDNVLDGRAGNDTVSYQYAGAGVRVSLAATGPQATGGSGKDTLLNVENLIGSRFDDRLSGNADANLFDGGAGNDVMNGGAGNDVYRYRSGDGNDRVLDDGGDDLVDLPDLQPGDVRIVQGLHGDDDRIVDRLTGQGITLDLNLEPAGSAASQVEHLRFADGTVWNAEQMRASAELDRQVQLLVQAMASFSPPAMGQSTLSPSFQDSLAPTIAVNPAF